MCVYVREVDLVIDTLQHKRRRWDNGKRESMLTLELITKDMPWLSFL